MGKTRCPFRGQSGPYRCECRALQEVFVELAVSGLASDLIEACGARAIMDISARAILLTDRPQRAIWVTSIRMRREDRTSTSVAGRHHSLEP
jgi:hypothetical protein